MKSELRAQIADDVFEGVICDDLVEFVDCGSIQLEICRPKNIDQLIEIGAARPDYKTSRYMPYWASIWPVSRYLAAYLFSWSWPSNKMSVLELGCGLGVAGIAALKSGQHVTFSDYDLAALRYARANALRNDCHEFECLALNWLQPVDRKFDVIIGSDLTFNQQLIPHLVNVLAAMLKVDGQVILADQNRMEDKSFRDVLGQHGLVASRTMFDIAETWAWNANGSIYHIQRL